MRRTSLAALMVLHGAACAVTGGHQSPFRQSSLDHNGHQPHRLALPSGRLQQVVDRLIELGKPRDMVLVRQSDCAAGRCSLAFRGKPVDRRIFRGTQSLTMSYYSRYFIELQRRGRRTVQITAVGVPVLGGEMACPRYLERSGGCRLARLNHPSGEDLVQAVRREWGYDISGANEAEMLQGLLAELQRSSGAPPDVVAPVRVNRPGPPAASAPTAADREAYERLRQQGKACYRQRDYRCALERFRQAQSRVPTPAMRFNIASAQDKLGLAVLAMREYLAYLRQAAAVPSEIKQHIDRRTEELARKVGRLRLTVHPAATAVRLNGTPQPRQDGGKWELVVEPGTHQLDLTCPGHRPASRTLTLLPGEQRALEITLRR